MEETTMGIVFKWSIDNFSCWNYEIHDKAITTKIFSFKKVDNGKIELYPKGISGREEHMVLRLSGIKLDSFNNDVSFMSSDGSLLFKQEINDGETIQGPKFEEVVSQIRKDEALYQDQLTLVLRCRSKEKGENLLCYMHSLLEVIENTVKISFILNNIAIMEGSLVMKYPYLNDGMVENIYIVVVCADTTDLIQIVLFVRSESLKKKFAVRTFMSVLNKNDDSVLRTEENEHVFRDVTQWIISDSLTKEEVRRNVCIILNLKIIPNNISIKHISNQYVAPLQGVNITPIENISRHPGTSPSKILPSKDPENSTDVLKTDFMCLYQDQEFSDFQLKCGDISFPVHRNVLSARSPVFKTMLSIDMREAASGTVDIGDLDAPTLARFLVYLYTGSVEDLQGESALTLYNAAEKYQVPTLKRECADFLRDNVSISNVCDVLSLSDRHQDDHLKSVAHDFILKNKKDVMKSEEWQSFLKSETLLAAKTLTLFFSE